MYFSDKKLWPRLNRNLFFDFCYKTAGQLAASEQYWRLPSSPIVEKNMCIFLVVVVAVVVVVVVAVDIVEDIAEDDDEDGARRR